MTGAIMGIFVVAVVLGVLLLSLNVRSAWPWPVKAAAIGITCAAFVFIYISALGLVGWPANAPLPERFLLLGADIQEPNKRTQNKGAATHFT